MILEAMYSGKFYSCETGISTSPEYRKVKLCFYLYSSRSYMFAHRVPIHRCMLRLHGGEKK